MSYAKNKMMKEPENTQHESYLRPFFKAMMESGYQWCVLHSADNLPYYSTSDVDIVVAGSLSHGIEKLIHNVADNTGWHVIQMLWYDVQYGKYYVLKNESTGVYLAVDILYDSDGLGRYGFKTSQLVEDPQFNGVFNQTNVNVEFAYKLVKRIEKKYFTDADKVLFLDYVQDGDAVRQQSLLNEQYGTKTATALLNKFSQSDTFPDFSDNDFKQLKQQHFIQRKILSLQFPRIIGWQLVRLKDRIFNPCGVVITIPSSRKEDAKKVLNLLKARMDLSFRSYMTAQSSNKRAIVNALVTSKLCIAYQQQVDDSQHQIHAHWTASAQSCDGEAASLANAVFADECSEEEQQKYTDFLVSEIETILIKRVRERSHV